MVTGINKGLDNVIPTWKELTRGLGGRVGHATMMCPSAPH